MKPEVYRSLAAWVVRRRLIAIALYAAVTALLAWSGSSIRMKADLADLLPSSRASGADLAFYFERFGSADALFFSLRPAGGAADPDLLEEAAEALASRLRASGLAREVRYGFTPEEGIAWLGRSLDHLPVLLAPEQAALVAARTSPGAIRAALSRLRSLAESGLLAGPAEAMAAQDPLGLAGLLPPPGPAALLPPGIDLSSGLLLSRDGGALLMIVTPLRPPQDLPFAKRLLAAAGEAVAAAALEFPGVAVDYAGGYLFAVQDEARIRHDLTVTSLIASAAIVGLFALALRRLTPLLVLMIPLATSTLWTLGIAAVWPGHLNVVTVAFAAILLGMGDDALTHLYLRFREHLAAGLPRGEAIVAALGSTGPSIVVATLSGGVAFGSLLFVEFRGLAELGLIAAIGLLNLLVSAFVLVPALLSFGARAAGPGASLGAPTVPMGAVVGFHRWASARPARRLVVLASALAVTLFAVAGLPRLRFSSDVASLRGDDPARVRLESVLAPFGGLPDPLHLVAGGDSVEAALAGAERLRALCDRLRGEGLASACASPSDGLPAPATQRRRFGAFASTRWDDVGRALEEAAGEAGMNAGWFAPFRERLARYASFEAVRLDPAAQGVAFGLSGLPSGWAADVVVLPAGDHAPAEVLARARELDPGAFGASTRAASVALVVADLAEVIAADFRRASFIALAAVALTAFAAFRASSRLLLVAVPVVNGSLLMIGGLAWLGIPIHLMNLVAAPLVFGLGINFGVYIVNRHDEEGGAGVERVLRLTGGPILLTGLTTLAGFGSLLAADFAGLAGMGWVAVLGIGACLASALLVLPLLLPAGPRR